VIAVTVVVQGVTGGLVARLLGVARGNRSGSLVLGAGPVARTLAGVLRDAGEEVVLVDSNPSSIRAAAQAGLHAVFGNGLEERTLLRAGAEDRARALALTANEEVNLLFAQRCRGELRIPEVWVALRNTNVGITPKMVSDLQAHLLLGGARDLAYWTVRLQRGEAALEVWEVVDTEVEPAFPIDREEGERTLLPLAVERKGRVAPWDERTTLKPADRIHLVLLGAERPQAVKWLLRHGLRETASGEDEG